MKRRITARSSAVLILVFLIGCAGATLSATDKKKKKEPGVPPINQMNEEQRIVHALNRFTFGPRPGDVEKVRAMGLDKWFEQQLEPEKIDDSALQARLEPLRTLKMSSQQLVETFPPPQVLKAMDEGKVGMPRDPEKRAIYESALATYRARKENQSKENQAKGADGEAEAKEMSADDEIMRAERAMDREQGRILLTDSMGKTASERYATILKMQPEQRRMALAGMGEEQRQQLVEGMSPEQRETLLALVRPQQVVPGELIAGKLFRATYSERQLEEVMTDFWFNHFNVFLNKGADRYLTTEYEREAIRAHALGKFQELLLATARHPAMLFYLDNWQSIGPDSVAAKGFGRGNRRFGFDRGPAPPRPPAQNRPSGLNENYARELMELHTMGVDGGYTQKDVTEVAKVFTGWTIRQPRQGGSFEYDDRRHEPGSKFVLGKKIGEHGEKEGKEVLEMLAHHPSTARFICKKLAMRFVSDDPPAALVERMADTFLSSDGDIKAVLRTLFQSPEFWAKDAYRAKVKTPLEFVVSSVRATGAEVKNPRPMADALQKLGMMPYGMQPPTGYSMKADAWVNSSALLNRMNFALALGGGKLRGIQMDQASVLRGQAMPRDNDTALGVFAQALLSGDLSAHTRETIQKQLSDPGIAGRAMGDASNPPTADPGLIAGLILGSPEFQRR